MRRVVIDIDLGKTVTQALTANVSSDGMVNGKDTEITRQGNQL